jgi:formin 2
MGRALVVAALAAVVIGGLVLVLIIIKLVRENARQREAAARPDAWPPVPRDRGRDSDPERAPGRPARRQAALMTQEYPAVDAQPVPQRLPGAEPRAGAPSGPMRVARAVPPPGPPPAGPITGPITGPQAVPPPGPPSGPMPYAEPPSGPHPVYAEPHSGPQPMPQPEPYSGPQNIPGQSAQKMQTPPPGWRPPVRTTRPESSNGKSSDDE